MKDSRIIRCCLAIFFLLACSNGIDNSKSGNIVINNDPAASSKQDSNASIQESTLLADGFDFPARNIDGKGSCISLSDDIKYDSWYVAVKTGDQFELGIHTGEDWNGSGGSNTDFGQPVYSIGKSIVITVGNYIAPLGNVIAIEHNYLENDTLNKVIAIICSSSFRNQKGNS